MSSTELLGWKDYFSIYPFTQDREDARIGLLASILVNINRSSKSSKVWTAKDFIPNFLGDEIETTPSKNLEEQHKELSEFKKKYLAIQGK